MIHMMIKTVTEDTKLLAPANPAPSASVARRTEPVESAFCELSDTTAHPDTVFSSRRAECHDTYPTWST
jgi:hypothetical protein